MLVANLLATPTEVVVTAELEDIGHQVVRFNDQVLNDGVNHGIRHFDSRNWDIAHVLEDGGEDDLAEILDEMLLEHGFPVLIVTKVKEQLLYCLTKGLVLGIFVELVAHELELVDDSVGVVAVTLAEKVSAVVVELIPLFVGGILHNEALFLEAFANVFVDALEPFLEFGVFLGVTVDVVDRLEEVVSRRAVRESFDQSLELSQHGSILAHKSYGDTPLSQLQQPGVLHHCGHL
jgi:hypothetical protein